MAGRINRYGLSDYIPANVRRSVRRDCGYGCVVCGLAFVQYEHFDPPFEEAQEHRPDGIALLCGACHDKKTRGVWSPEKIAAARRSPITFRGGQARDALDIVAPFTLWLGSSSFEDVTTIIRTHEGERWLSIEPSEAQDGPTRIHANFFDDQGNPSLTIDGNDWIPFSSQWDTEAEGRRITVRNAPGQIALELIAMPPRGLNLSRLRMRKADLAIVIEPSGVTKIERRGGETVLDECFISGSDAVFLI